MVVERDLAGIRLQDLLGRSCSDVHRGDLRQLIASGGVSVNGETCLHDRKLRLGDVVILSQQPAKRRHSQKKDVVTPSILADTGGALVVDKPACMPSAGDRSGPEQSVHGLLKALRPDDDLRIVHRLDRNASGCLILAKGLVAARHLEDAFREGRVGQSYVALVTGVPTVDELQVDAFLGPDRRRPGRVVADSRQRTGFREAHTTVRVLQRFDRHALLELLPTTCRGHQLRVHLQSIGHPIVGDDEYGGERLLLSRLKADYKKRTGVEERPLLQRMFLHAQRVAFVDVDGSPVDGSPVDGTAVNGSDVVAEAPMPEDLNVALRHVEKHTSTRRTQCD